MKAKPCTLVLNTRWGYILSPIDCDSIKQALGLAKDFGMAYRIFDHSGKLLRSGWRT